MRRQAWRVWCATLAVALAWVALILAAPVARSLGFEWFSALDYGFFGHVCHQMPERSFFVAGHPFAVCARCFGVYFGLVAGFLIYPWLRGVDTIDPPARFWLLLAMIPIGVDWSLGVFDIWNNTHLSRVVTGTILGVGCAIFIVPAVVEIIRLATGRRKSKRLSN